MKVERNISFPSEAAEVSIRQLVKYMKLTDAEKADDFNILQVFADNLSKHIEANEGKDLAGSLRELLNSNMPFIQTFKFNEIEYGIIPDFDDITVGEYSDISTLQDFGIWENIHRILTILYRPIQERKGDDYKIKTYEGINEKLAVEFLELSAQIPVGAIGFFFGLQQDLVRNTQQSLIKTPKLTNSH